MAHYKTYNQFLLENLNPLYFYHGTKEIRLPNILKNDLCSGQKDSDTICVTTSLEDAEYYSIRKSNDKPAILRFKNNGKFKEVKGKIDEYTSEESIKSEEIEVKVKNTWIRLEDYMKFDYLLEYQRQDISLLESMDNYFTIGFEIEIEPDHDVDESLKLYMSRKEQKKVSNFEKNCMNFIMKYSQDITYHFDETLVNGLEIVSIPFKSLKKAKDYIKLFFNDFENQDDWIFNHRTSIHVNVGVTNKDWNVVKGIIMMSDDYTFKDIESRKNSEYCKSLKSEIEREMYSKTLPKDNTIKSMEDSINLLLSSTIIKSNNSVGSNKEFGINISKVLFDHLNYIEYRHIGNSKINQQIVIDKLMYYCYITHLMTSNYKDKEYYRKLSGFMEKIKQRFIKNDF